MKANGLIEKKRPCLTKTTMSWKFDAMREKVNGYGRQKTGEKSSMAIGNLDRTINAISEIPSPEGEGDYRPKLSVRTHQIGKSLTLEIEDNGRYLDIKVDDKTFKD